MTIHRCVDASMHSASQSRSSRRVRPNPRCVDPREEPGTTRRRGIGRPAAPAAAPGLQGPSTSDRPRSTHDRRLMARRSLRREIRHGSTPADRWSMRRSGRRTRADSATASQRRSTPGAKRRGGLVAARTRAVGECRKVNGQRRCLRQTSMDRTPFGSAARPDYRAKERPCPRPIPRRPAPPRSRSSAPGRRPTRRSAVRCASPCTGPARPSRPDRRTRRWRR